VLAWVTVKTNSTARRHDDEKRAEDRLRDDRLRQEALDQWVQGIACGPPSTTTSCLSLSGQTGNVTPVSSSETVHRRRWMAVSWDCPLEWANFG
jgi:hypothetical protein